jgi:DinB family protein
VRATEALLDQAAIGWRPFRAAALALSADELDRLTSGGWSYKAMLLHVSAWHDLTAWRLRSYGETGRVGPPAGPEAAKVFDELGFRPADRETLLRDWHFDRFNAAVAAIAKDRTAEDVLSELDASFARVSAALAALTDEQVNAHVENGKRGCGSPLRGEHLWALRRARRRTPDGRPLGHPGAHSRPVSGRARPRATFPPAFDALRRRPAEPRRSQ